MKTERATRRSWKGIKPLPRRRARLQLERRFDEREYECLSRGLIPMEMEDKWFVYLEKGRLRFHRSWTGSCIYDVRIVPDGGQYRIAEAWVNRDQRQYTETNDEYDARLLMFLIEGLLLHKDVSFPGHSDKGLANLRPCLPPRDSTESDG